MNRGMLVAAQLSSLFPSAQVTSVPLQTSRRNTPLPPRPTDSDPPAEHALYSTILHTPSTGTILMRVIHGGLILELISLSSDVPPIRFVFPAAVLSSPAIFLWESCEVHILAVTSVGSLYRLVLPGSKGKLWHDQVTRNWCREHLIQNIRRDVEGLIHVQGTHAVIIGLTNGSILRLETECLGDENNDDHWTETMFHHNSFLTSLANFLPTLSSGSSNGSEIISMASHPQPTDIGHVWTLSRDRTLRLWTAKSGCVSAKTLPLTSFERAVSIVPGTTVNDSNLHILLDAESQRLLRVFSVSLSPEKEQHFVLAFSPVPASSQSGGFFQLFSTDAEYLHSIGTIQCSEASAHCYLQDFVVVNEDTLYVLWDRQGQSMVERMVLSPGQMMGQSSLPSWLLSSYPPEPELTPTCLDELLLSPGSMTDKFYEAIMRPGMFSALTLRMAIDQYTNACMSLPGPPHPRLMTTYATLGEHIAAVVGSTVSLHRDPHTGTLQHANYWNALKRDWEGFIARCREVERSARWPLALGVGENSDIIIVERERAGALVREDFALQVHGLVSSSYSIEPQHALLGILWTLRTKLGHQSVINLENRLVDILHQETAFPFADIIDEARQSKFMDDLDEGLVSWMNGRLQSIENLDVAIHSVLDIVGGFDQQVKTEEDDSDLLLPDNTADWTRALIATYTASTIHARYDLCLALVTLLFLISEDLVDWEPALLVEIIAVFRGIAMLRYLAHQPAGSGVKAPLDDTRTADDVVSRMRDMQVSKSQTRFIPTYSLIHRLLAESNDTQAFPGAAHRFLDATGLLQSTSPTHVAKAELLFCEKLRLLGYYEVAKEMLSWLPRTPGVSYVLARLWLSTGRADDAAYLLEKLAGSFGINSGLSAEDSEALDGVLPGAASFYSDYAFYLHAASLFKPGSLICYDVHFSQLALSVARPEADTIDLWYSVIKGHIDLALYEDAYASLIACPYNKLKRECVSELVYRMCEGNAVEKLMTFSFAGFADEVELSLAFKSRNADPRVRPFYSRILYTWYVLRGEYRNSALTMYQRARKLHDLIGDPAQLLSLAEEQLEAYVVAMNSLALLDRANAWILMPVTAENGREPRKRRKLSKHIPESKFMVGKHDSEIIELADIEYEYALLSARLDLVRKHPSLLTSAEFLLPPTSIVLKLAQSNRFNTAMATARSLNIDMTDLFAHLTRQCLRISRSPDSVIQEDLSDWLLTDKVSSWPGTHADRSWRYLRLSLERHDNAETDYKYIKVTLETILAFDRSTLPPPWLLQSLAEHHPEYLIRISLRYDIIEQALEYVLSLIHRIDARLAHAPPQNSSLIWLPYPLIDQVLAAAASGGNLSSRAGTLLRELQADIANRPKRMQKLSQFSS